MADLLRHVSDLVDETVTRITDADVEEQLSRVLGRAVASPAPDQETWTSAHSRLRDLGRGLQEADVSPAPADESGESRIGSASVASGPYLLRMLMGTQLRRLREARGITAQQAAKAIRASEAKISRIELGRIAFREVDIADLLSLYGVTDLAERAQMLALASQANQPGWWQSYQDVLPVWFQAYILLEESAESIRSYDSQFVPGLLQTEEYASAVIELGEFSLEEAERLVFLRKERQMRFALGSLRLSALIDEMALRRPVGGPELMRGQLEYLLEVSDRPGLTLQVTPYPTGGSYLVPGSFSIMRFATKDVVYVEQLTSAMYLEKPVDVMRYTAAMDKVSSTSATPERTRQFIRELLTDLEAPL